MDVGLGMCMGGLGMSMEFEDGQQGLGMSMGFEVGQWDLGMSMGLEDGQQFLGMSMKFEDGQQVLGMSTGFDDGQQGLRMCMQFEDAQWCLGMSKGGVKGCGWPQEGCTWDLGTWMSPGRMHMGFGGAHIPGMRNNGSGARRCRCPQGEERVW